MRIIRHISWCQEPIEYKICNFILTLSGKLIGKRSFKRTSLGAVPLCGETEDKTEYYLVYKLHKKSQSLFHLTFDKKSVLANLTHGLIPQAGFWMSFTSYHESNPPSKGKDLLPWIPRAFEEHPSKEFPRCLEIDSTMEINVSSLPR